MQVWLDNLFIRVHRLPQNAVLSETHPLAFNQGSAWLTNITMQNDNGTAVALKSSLNAHVYAAGMGVNPVSYKAQLMCCHFVALRFSGSAIQVLK